MLKYFLLLLIIYVYTIIRNIINLRNINSCIQILKDYLSSADFHLTSYNQPVLAKKSNYNTNLAKLLAQYPEISKFTTIYSPSLSYGATDEDTYQKAVKLFNELLMSRNYLERDLKSAFNPINALKNLLALPSFFISSIGFNLSSISSKLINVIGWIAAYCLNIYSDEIKVLISSLFK